MATRIVLKHMDTGGIKDGYHGFSWTTLFFGVFPALFRRDHVLFIAGLAIYGLSIITLGYGALLVSLAWAFMYNQHYTRRLLEQGYVSVENNADNMRAAAALGIIGPRPAGKSPSWQDALDEHPMAPAIG